MGGQACKSIAGQGAARVLARASGPAGLVASYSARNFVGELPMRSVAVFACALMLIGFGAVPGHADKRVALVVGNGAYAHAPRLTNPHNDAEDVSAALKRN